MKVAKYAALLGVGLMPAVAAAGMLSDYSTVTSQRLTNPEAGNWLMTRGNYWGWMYSPLDQINTANAGSLKPVWSFSTGVDSGHEAPPIVNDGVMFVATPYAQVIALKAATGDLIWRYRRELPDDFGALHNTSRGVALYGNNVYLTGLEPTTLALDAKTGKVVWETVVEDYHTGYYQTMAPLIVDGKVMVGVSGGEFGVRGFVQALDAETGKPAWKTFTIPGPGEPGNDTWPGDTWKRGGGAVWNTGTYDPELGLTFWGAGNGSPWFGDQREGDNLYTSSTIAIDPKDGSIKGHFQYHWNDSWDWDEMNAPTVVNFEHGGKMVKGLIKPARNGYLYWLERKANGIGFVDAKAYVKQDVFKSIDPSTGRPTYNDDRKPGTGKYAGFCPSLWGGKDWPFEAYNPKTGLLYIPANENHCGFLEGKVQEYVAGQWWTGVDIPDIGFVVEKSARHFGEIQAWNLNTGEQVWSQLYPGMMNWGSLLTTGGGLVFNGGTNDRYFRAYDARTGEALWGFRTNSGIMAPPASYEVDGVQYVAVASGWGVDPAFQQGLMNNLLGTDTVVPQGGVIWAFALGE
ncbi:MAG TPA: PQQ-dependent dehydrogenase, methanol/ethanol family [Alphaproteobacteria bacterium]